MLNDKLLTSSGRNSGIRFRLGVDHLKKTKKTNIISISSISKRVDLNYSNCRVFVSGVFSQCSVTCGVGQAERIVGCRMDNGSVVDSSYCIGQDRPISVQQCFEHPCPTEPPTTPSTVQPTTQQPSTTNVAPTSAVPAASLALAGFRPQPIEIHNIDPAINSLDPAEWNPESNDIPRVVAAWRTGTWGQVK